VPRIAASAFDVALGARVRARRRARSISQVELGIRLDITFQQVQRYEAGVDRISVSSLVVIAEVLQCSVNELLLSESSTRPTGRKKSVDPEVNEAAEAFSRIPSAATRKKVLALLRTLAKRQS